MTILQVIWFILIAVLWTGYLVLEGFGVGAGMVMPGTHSGTENLRPSLGW